MIAVDSSVVIAGFASWHEQHSVAIDVLTIRPSLPWHASLETYSVLTRLPGGVRVEPAVVVEFLAEHFPDPMLLLPTARARQLPAALAELGVQGGATYDAVIALTCVAHDAELLTLDRRADSTYARCGVRTRLVA